MGVSVLPAYLCEAAPADGRPMALDRPELPPINTGCLAVRASAAVARVHDCVAEILRAL